MLWWSWKWRCPFMMPLSNTLKKYPFIIFAGKEYGTGSSRDWAAKGTKLLGIKAVMQRVLREYIAQI